MESTGLSSALNSDHSDEHGNSYCPATSASMHLSPVRTHRGISEHKKCVTCGESYSPNSNFSAPHEEYKPSFMIWKQLSEEYISNVPSFPLQIIKGQILSYLFPLCSGDMNRGNLQEDALTVEQFGSLAKTFGEAETVVGCNRTRELLWDIVNACLDNPGAQNYFGRTLSVTRRILYLLTHSAEEYELIDAALTAVAVLIRCGEYRPTTSVKNLNMLTTAGLAKILATVLRCHIDRHSTCERVFLVISHFAFDKRQRLQLVEEGVCEYIVKAIEIHKDHCVVIDRALSAIFNLIPEEKSVDIFVRCNIFQVLLPQLTSQSETILSAAYGIIGVILQYPKHCGYIVQAGAVDAITLFPTLWINSEHTMQNYILAVGWLSFQGIGNLSHESKNHLYSITLSTLKMYPASKSIQLLGLLAFFSWVDDTDISPANKISTCATLMNILSNTDCYAVIILGCLLVSKIVNTADNMREFVGTLACAPLTKVTQLLVDNKFQCPTNSCGALLMAVSSAVSALCHETLANQQEFFRLGIIEILKGLLESDIANVTHVFPIALQMCMNKKTINTDIVDTMLIENIHTIVISSLNANDLDIALEESTGVTCDMLGLVALLSFSVTFRHLFGAEGFQIILKYIQKYHSVRDVKVNLFLAFGSLVPYVDAECDLERFDTLNVIAMCIKRDKDDMSLIMSSTVAMTCAIRSNGSVLSLELADDIISSTKDLLQQYVSNRNIVICSLKLVYSVICADKSSVGSSNSYETLGLVKLLFDVLRRYINDKDVVCGTCWTLWLLDIKDFVGGLVSTIESNDLILAAEKHIHDSVVCTYVFLVIKSLSKYEDVSIQRERLINFFNFCVHLHTEDDKCLSAAFQLLSTVIDHPDGLAVSIDFNGMLAAFRRAIDTSSAVLVSQIVADLCILLTYVEYQRVLGAMGIGELLLSCLEKGFASHDTEIRLLRCICHIFENVSDEQENRNDHNMAISLLNAGCVQVIIRTMERNTVCADIVEAGYSLLKNVALCSSGRIKIWYEWDYVSNHIDRYFDDPPIFARIVLVLQKLCLFEEVPKALTCPKYCKYFLVRHFDTDSEMSILSGKLISTLLSFSDSPATARSAQEIFLEQNMVELVIGKLNDKSLPLERYVCEMEILFGLLNHNEISVGVLVNRDDLLSLLTDFVSAHISESSLALLSMIIVTELCSDRSLYTNIRQCKVLFNSSVHAIAVHEDNPAIVYNCCQCIVHFLRLFVEEELDFVDRNLISTLTDAMRRNMENESLANIASNAITMLSRRFNVEAAREANDVKTQFERIAEMLSEAAKFKDFALIATSASEIVDLSCGEIDENVSLISSRIYEQLHEALVVSVGNSFAQIAILKAIVYLCGHNDRPFQHRSHVVGKFIAMRTDLAVFRCLSMMYHNCRISEFATLLLHFFISYSNSSDESLELPRLLQLTCEVLNRHDDDMTTLQNSCLLITTILNASNNSELCSSDHLCEQLCVSLLTGMNDSTSALRIVSALSSLIYTQSYDHATYMVRRQHILKNLLSILRAHMEHNSTVTAVCTLITNLSVSIGKDFNAILYELGGHQVLIEVLRRDSCTSETTIYSVYDTIYTVSQHMSPCSNHFNHNGIWELVIRDVERFQWEANVMKIVCLCIPVLLIETDDLVGINFQIMLEMCIKIPRVHSRKCEVILAVVMAIECILGTEFSFSISTLRSLLDMLGPLFEQYLHEHELVQQFSLILIRITSRINEFEHIENFIDCSLCGTIVSGLYTYSRHETIFSLFCSLLSSMFSDSIAYSSKLYDCGICDTLDSILRENFNDLNVFRHTCEVMSAVPPHSKCSQRLSSLDICRNVSCMIVRFNVDPDIGLLWTKAIIVLASEERSFSCFKETDLIEKLWWLLENCDSNELVVQSVFQIFYLLGVHEDFCSALCSENGCEKLIVHLEKYTGSPDVLLSVLKSLCVLSVHGEYRIRFRSRRVAIVVYKIVTTFAAEDILKEAFKLISILSSCNADMQNIFFEIGVLDAVCDYVNQSSEINLVGAALGATAKMIERNEMRKSWVAEKNLCDELTNWSTRLYNLSPQTLLNILTAIKCFSEMESYYLKSFSTATFVELYIISLKSYVTLLGASTEYDDLYCTLLTVSVMTSSSIYCTDSKLQIKVCDLFLESVHMKSSARITALAIEYISAIVKSDKLLISRCYDSGILDRYVELLTVCTDERTTFPVICQSIVVFSNSNKNLLAEYVDQRLIDSIVKRILEFRSDVLIVSDGYEALVSLISPELMSSVNFELLVVLVTAVVNSVDEESILKRLCSTVAILAHMSPSLSNLLGSARVCDALIHILYIHFGNLDIYSAVIVAVVNLTAESDTNCAVFAAAGLCSGLSQWFSCELSPSNVVNTCCAIVNICADNGGAMSNMAREGKCASLLSLYDKNIGQRACVLSILRVVEILVRDKLSLQESEHNNCVNLLQLTAKQYDDDPEVFSLAMGLLSSFDSSVPTTQSEVFQSACIKAVESLKLYIHNAEMVCELCSGIISLMANSDVSADILGGCGLCVLCDNILKNHSQNANVVSSVCIVIGYLALNSATSLKTFEATSVAQQIVASYDVFLDVFETCSALTFSIRNLVRSDVIMVSMMEYGVCDSLMKSLELYSKHNGDIVAMNCWALRKLTSPSSNYDNTHALDVVIQRGGLLLTCDIISHNSHNIPTFTAAVALLGSIISNGIGIVEAEQRIRGALMSALSKHIESENLCRYGLCLLVAFVENFTCCTISAANSESCDIVLESVQEHMTCSAIADMGCEYISRVVLIDTELVGVLNDRRRLDVILQCLLLYGKEHISIVLSCVKLAKVLIQQNRVSVLYDVISTEYSCPGALENYFTSFEMAELILSTFAIVLQRNFFSQQWKSCPAVCESVLNYFTNFVNRFPIALLGCRIIYFLATGCRANKEYLLCHGAFEVISATLVKYFDRSTVISNAALCALQCLLADTELGVFSSPTDMLCKILVDIINLDWNTTTIYTESALDIIYELCKNNRCSCAFPRHDVSSTLIRIISTAEHISTHCLRRVLSILRTDKNILRGTMQVTAVHTFLSVLECENDVAVLEQTCGLLLGVWSTIVSVNDYQSIYSHVVTVLAKLKQQEGIVEVCCEHVIRATKALASPISLEHVNISELCVELLDIHTTSIAGINVLSTVSALCDFDVNYSVFRSCGLLTRIASMLLEKTYSEDFCEIAMKCILCLQRLPSSPTKTLAVDPYEENLLIRISKHVFHENYSSDEAIRCSCILIEFLLSESSEHEKKFNDEIFSDDIVRVVRTRLFSLNEISIRTELLSCLSALCFFQECAIKLVVAGLLETSLDFMIRHIEVEHVVLFCGSVICIFTGDVVAHRERIQDALGSSGLHVAMLKGCDIHRQSISCVSTLLLAIYNICRSHAANISALIDNGATAIFTDLLERYHSEDASISRILCKICYEIVKGNETYCEAFNRSDLCSIAVRSLEYSMRTLLLHDAEVKLDLICTLMEVDQQCLDYFSNSANFLVFLEKAVLEYHSSYREFELKTLQAVEFLCRDYSGQVVLEFRKAAVYNRLMMFLQRYSGDSECIYTGARVMYCILASECDSERTRLGSTCGLCAQLLQLMMQHLSDKKCVLEVATVLSLLSATLPNVLILRDLGVSKSVATALQQYHLDNMTTMVLCNFIVCLTATSNLKLELESHGVFHTICDIAISLDYEDRNYTYAILKLVCCFIECNHRNIVIFYRLIPPPLLFECFQYYLLQQDLEITRELCKILAAPGFNDQTLLESNNYICDDRLCECAVTALKLFFSDFDTFCALCTIISCAEGIDDTHLCQYFQLGALVPVIKGIDGHISVMKSKSCLLAAGLLCQYEFRTAETSGSSLGEVGLNNCEEVHSFLLLQLQSSGDRKSVAILSSFLLTLRYYFPTGRGDITSSVIDVAVELLNGHHLHYSVYSNLIYVVDIEIKESRIAYSDSLRISLLHLIAQPSLNICSSRFVNCMLRILMFLAENDCMNMCSAALCDVTVRVLCEAMKSVERDTVKLVCDLISKLCKDCPANRDCFATTDIHEEICNTLKLEYDSELVGAAVITAVFQLCGGDSSFHNDNCRLLLRYDIDKCIASLLERSNITTEMILTLFLCMKNLSELREYCQRFGDERTIKLFLQIYKNNTHSSETLASVGLAIIRNLVAVDGNSEQFCDASTLGKIMSVLSVYGDCNSTVAMDCVVLLNSLLSNTPPCELDSLRVGDAYQDLVNSLRRHIHLENSSTVLYICHLIVKLSSKSDDSKSRLCSSGAVVSLEQALSTFDNNRDVVFSVLSAMRCLSFVPSFATYISNTKFCVIISQVLSQYIDDLEIVDQLLGTVSNASSFEEDFRIILIESKFCCLVMTYPERNCDSPAISVSILKILIYFVDHANTDQFPSRSVTNVILNVLSSHKSNPTVCKYGSMAARYFSELIPNAVDFIECQLHTVVADLLSIHFERVIIIENTLICLKNLIDTSKDQTLVMSNDFSLGHLCEICSKLLNTYSSEVSIVVGSCDIIVSALKSHVHDQTALNSECVAVASIEDSIFDMAATFNMILTDMCNLLDHFFSDSCIALKVMKAILYIGVSYSKISSSSIECDISRAVLKTCASDGAFNLKIISQSNAALFCEVISILCTRNSEYLLTAAKTTELHVIILEIMVLYCQARSVSSSACTAFYQFISINPDVICLCDVKYLQSIQNILQLHMGCTSVVEMGSNVVMMLASHEHFVLQSRRLVVVKTLLEAIKCHIKSPESVVASIFSALLSLSADTECSVVMCTHGVCVVAFDCITNRKSCVSLVTVCTELIMKLASRECTNKYVRESLNCHAQLVRILHVCYEDDNIVRNVCVALDHIIKSESDNAKIISTNIDAAISKCLDSRSKEVCPSDNAAIKPVVNLVIVICKSCPLFCRKLSELNLCEAMVKMLHLCRHAELSEALLSAINALAVTSENKARFGTSHCCKVVIESLESFNYEASLVCIGCSCISKICSDDPEIKVSYGNAGCCTVVIGLLRVYVNNQSVVSYACAALWSLINNCIPNVVIVSEVVGACDVLVDLLTIFSDSDLVCGSVCGILALVLENNSTHFYSLKHHNLLDLSLSVLTKHLNSRVAVLSSTSLVAVMLTLHAKADTIGDVLDGIDSIFIALTQCLRDRMEDTVLMTEVCGAISSLAMAVTSKGCATLESRDTCSLLSDVAAFALSRRVKTLAQASSLAITSLCQGRRSIQLYFSETSICSTVVGFLRMLDRDNSDDSIDVAVSALNAVAHLARHSKSKDTENQLNIEKLMTAGACEISVSVLTKRIQNRIVAFSASRVIFYLAGGGNDVCTHRLNRSGACEAMVEVHRHYQRDLHVSQYSCGAIANLALLEHNNSLLLASDVPESIITTLLSCGTEDPDVAAMACIAINNLTGNRSQIRTKMGKAGACTAIVKALSMFRTNCVVVRAASGAIANLVLENDMNADALVKTDAIGTIVESALVHVDDIGVSHSALLFTLSICGTVAGSASSFLDSSICNVLSQIFSLHNADSALIRLCCITINVLCEDDNRTAGTMAKLLIPAKITTVLFDHLDDASVMLAGLKSILLLAQNYDDNIHVLISSGAGNLITQTLSFDPISGKIAYLACRVLNVLSRDNPAQLSLVHAGVCSKLCSVLELFTPDEDIVLQICYCVQSLTSSCVESRDTLYESGLCQGITSALQLHSGSKKTGREICCAMWALIDDNIPALKDISHEKTCVSLVTFMQKYIGDFDCVNIASKLMKMIARSSICRSVFGKCGGCDCATLALEQNFDQREGCLNIIGALHALSVENKNNCEILGIKGACELAAKVLSSHIESAQIIAVCLKFVRCISEYLTNKIRLGKCEVPKLIVTVLKLYTEDTMLLKLGSSIVTSMCDKHDSNSLLFAEAGIFPALRPIIELHTSDTALMVVVFDAIFHLLSSEAQPDTVDGFVTCGLVDSLVDAMHIHLGKSAVIYNICRTIKLLAIPPNHVDLVNTGVCENLVLTLSCHLSDKSVNTIICATIRAVADRSSNRYALGTYNVCSALIKALQFAVEFEDCRLIEEALHTIYAVVKDCCANQIAASSVCDMIAELVGAGNGEEIDEHALWCIAYLCQASDDISTSNELNATKFGENGSIQSIVIAVQDNFENSRVVIAGFTALRNLCSVSVNVGRMTFFGCCDLVCATIRRHLHNIPVCRVACQALTMFCSTDNVRTLLACDVVNLLTDMLVRHSSIKEILTHTCHCISRIVSNDLSHSSNFSMDICSIVISSFQLFADDTDVVLKACDVVCALSGHSHEYKVCFGSSGMIEALVQVTEQHRRNVIVMEAISRALATLSDRCIENNERIKVTGGQDLLWSTSQISRTWVSATDQLE